MEDISGALLHSGSVSHLKTAIFANMDLSVYKGPIFLGELEGVP